MKHEIRLAFNFKYKNFLSIYKLPDNKKEKIVNDNTNKMIKNDNFASDAEHEINNFPNMIYLINTFSIFSNK